MCITFGPPALDPGAIQRLRDVFGGIEGRRHNHRTQIDRSEEA
jgi:hypothetical protein